MLRHAMLATLVAVATLAAPCDGGGSRDDVTTRTIGSTARFNHGVASGDVTADSAVLWTLADNGDRLLAEVAPDAAFAGDVTTIETETSAGRDFTVKVRVEGLTPGTRYWYRFRAGTAVSDTGMFSTAPDSATSAPVRFVFSGDSDGSRQDDGSPPFNEFQVLDAARAAQPAFFLYFGDTIYADRAPKATALAGYRAKYRENRGYRALRDILAAAPAYTMWDDHEVVNDFAGTTADPAMFEAGRRAFREFMPIADSGDPAAMYRSFRWGRDVDIFILDQRSFRDASAEGACDGDPLPARVAPGVPDAVRAAGAFAQVPETLPAACLATLDDPARTLLGGEQQAAFERWLTDTDATWKVVVNPVPIQALLFLPYDRWEGYAAERREILQYIRDNDVRNVVFLATDFHANIFGPVRIDPFDGAPPVAYEAIAGPIATTPLEQYIVEVIGEAGAGLLDSFLTGVAGVDCASLNSYAYALVDADATSMSITAKDADGNVLCEQRLDAR